LFFQGLVVFVLGIDTVMQHRLDSGNRRSKVVSEDSGGSMPRMIDLFSDSWSDGVKIADPRGRRRWWFREMTMIIV